jgi:hypothetical protein
MSATQNVGYLKCRRLQQNVSYSKCRRLQQNVSYSKCRRPNFLLFGLGGLSTLLSFSVRLKFSFYSFWRCCSSTSWSSSGICSQTCPAYMGGMSAVLARLLVLARHDENMPKCRHPRWNVGAYAECRRLLTFWPFFWEFSPAFRGRLLGSYHSDQRAVKRKYVPFGLLFQISPLGTLWAWPERLHVNKKAGQSPFPRLKKSSSAHRCPTTPIQICICSQKLSESSSITFKSLNRDLLTF